MVGDATNQGIGIATGLQDSFNFKQTALAGLKAFAPTPLPGGTGAIQTGNIFADIAVNAGASALRNAASQGLRVATGIQDKFSFAQVGFAALAGGTAGASGGEARGGRIGQALRTLESAVNFGRSIKSTVDSFKDSKSPDETPSDAAEVRATEITAADRLTAQLERISANSNGPIPIEGLTPQDRLARNGLAFGESQGEAGLTRVQDFGLGQAFEGQRMARVEQRTGLSVEEQVRRQGEANVETSKAAVNSVIGGINDTLELTADVFGSPQHSTNPVHAFDRNDVPDIPLMFRIEDPNIQLGADIMVGVGGFFTGGLTGAGKISKADDLAGALGLVSRIPGARFLNLRQPNGASFFDIPSLKSRGNAIENALGNNTPGPFKVIDRQSPRELVSIKSHDLTLSSFSKPSGLRDVLRRNIRALERFDGDVKGRTVVRPGDNRPKVLETVIQEGKASPDQIRQLTDAVQYAQQRGVTLRIIEIP